MKPKQHLQGLVAATHTPFAPDGALNLGAIEAQARHLVENGVRTVFIGGTTGESSSLSLQERLTLAQRWVEVARGTPLQIIVHVGSNCLEDSKALAVQAGRIGAMAISALAPNYFKPPSVAALVACCVQIASSAPDLPFYYYHIPSLTGVAFRMTDFLSLAGEQIPTLVGMKFTCPDLMSYLQCLRMGEWDIPWGLDEWLLGALATGARAAVGSSFNFAAPLYHQIIREFEKGNLEAARILQYRSTSLIELLGRYGYMGAAKAVMSMVGVDVGPPRLPNQSLEPAQVKKLRVELEALGFFDWVQSDATGAAATP